MNIDWNEIDHPEQRLLSAATDAQSDAQLQVAVQAAIEQAVAQMNTNVRDESRYFICEWNDQQALLSIVVTDQSKSIESPTRVELSLPALQAGEASQNSSAMKFWITDYLSTCTEFLRFSVIALFHTGDPNRGTLL